MRPLDRLEKWAPRLGTDAEIFLNEEEMTAFQQIPPEERQNQLRAIFQRPIAAFTPVNEVYFRARWGELLRLLHPNPHLMLLEVASGDADMIPQAMARTHPHSRYVTANMNRILTRQLLERTKNLNLTVEVVEDDAQNIAKYLGKDSVDIIAFQHAVNDVIQAILCDRQGIDTIYADWMETLPKMIEILQREVRENTLEQHAKEPFLRLMEVLAEVLKPQGVVAINHYMFQLDLDWGYPPDLFENVIPMVRRWITELPLYEEFTLDEFDRHWWMFLRKR